MSWCGGQIVTSGKGTFNKTGNTIMTHTMKNEILSPAGSIETLYAGINAGADAVYIGGQKFGARAYAQNPDNNELLRAIDYVHLHNKKIYLTVNTLLKSNELEEQLYDYLLPLYRHGLDAVIVQDIGVFQFIRDNFGGLDLHASTQMAVTDIESAALLKNMGATRIVTARELSLAELDRIHNSVDIEMESFIHGAMCYCYSGMCLFSSMVGGRSGNRGRCAGPCRQPYEIYKNNRKLNDKNTLYALSLKDMNTLEILPEIIDCGVYSLKIEGRMKSPEYAAFVVSIYRKYVDLYNEKGREHFKIDKKDMRNLMALYTRSGSTTGYYKCHNAKNMISLNKPAYKSDNAALIREIHQRYCENILKRKADAHIILNAKEPIRLTVSDDNTGIMVTVTGEKAGAAITRPIEKENILKQLHKTGDSFTQFSDIDIELGKNVFVPVSHLNELRRDGIKKFEDTILSNYRRSDYRRNSAKIKENRIPANTCRQDTIQNTIKNSTQEKTAINISCQISTHDQLSCALRFSEIHTICISTDRLTNKECIDAIKKVIESGRECYVSLPAVYRENGREYVRQLMNDITLLRTTTITEAAQTGSDSVTNNDNLITFLVKNIDELGFMVNNGYQNFAVDSSLYAFNRYAKNYYYELGAKRVTLPYELNYSELKNLADSRDELIIYGRTPLMVSAGCISKNFDKCTRGANTRIELKDRKGAYFTSVCCCNFCYNIIYNGVPISLLGVSDKVLRLNTKNYRINLTTENYDTAVEVLEKNIKVFYYKEYCKELTNFTRGHFNRGVE